MLNQPHAAKPARIAGETLLHAFARHNIDGIALINEDGRVMEWNSVMEEVTGISAQEALGAAIWDIQILIVPAEQHTPSLQERYRQTFQEMIQSGVIPERLVSNVSQLHRKDGREVFAEQKLFIINTGPTNWLGAVVRDITDRKKAEQALRLSEQKFSNAFQTVPVLMSIEDENNRFIDVNEAFIQTIGYERAEVIGKRASDLNMWAAAEDMESVRKMLRENNGIFKDLELRFRRRSGEIGVALMSTEKFEVDGKIYTLTSALDITERKRVEAEREKLIAELASKNAELERFTYTVSHDLKSPIVTISGFLGLLEKDAMAGNIERMRSDIKRIGEAADKMQELLKDLLELSRIGRMMNAPEKVPFEILIDDALKAVEGRLHERGVEIKTQAELPAVYGDRLRLTEVLQNLLDNATKFMGNQPKPLIEIGMLGEENGKPIFFVKDNGIGIAPEHHERVFGLFNKLNPQAEGTGIGLALVKRIIEVHGGRIWIESELDRGCVFCFTLEKAHQ